MSLTCTVMSFKPSVNLAEVDLSVNRNDFGPRGSITRAFEMHRYYNILLEDISEEYRNDHHRSEWDDRSDPLIWMVYGRHNVFKEHGYNDQQDVCQIAESIKRVDSGSLSFPHFGEAVRELRSLYEEACARGEVVFCFVD